MFKNLEDLWNFFIFFLKIFMKFEAKNLSPVAFHALICVEVSVSIKCFDWSKMAAEVFPVARIDEYAKPCEPAIHVLRSVNLFDDINIGWKFAALEKLQSKFESFTYN